MNPEVTAYIVNAGPHTALLQAIRQLIHESVPQVQEEFKWSRPVFRAGKDFTYLKTAKAYVTVGFFDFQKLADPNGLLEGTGKDMRHLKVRSLQALDSQLLTQWFKTAAAQ
jgi:hypothetical protein